MNISECLDAIRKAYNITEDQDIPIQKIDWNNSTIVNDTVPSYKSVKSDITYNFYHPVTGEKLDITEVCKEAPVELKIPVEVEALNLTLIENFQPQRVNLYNKEDDFYTSVCVTYVNDTSNTEVTANQRRDRIFPGISFSCSDGCTFTGFDENYYQICDCRAVNQTTTEEDISLFNPLDASNLEVFICFNQAFESTTLKTNPGFYVNGLVLVGCCVLVLVYSLVTLNPILSDFKETFRNDATMYGFKEEMMKSRKLNINI